MGVFVKQDDGWLNLETGAPPAVDPTKAGITSDPVAVSALVDPVSYFVKLNDGSDKKLWVLPGNTGQVVTSSLRRAETEEAGDEEDSEIPIASVMQNDPQPQAVYEVGLGTGVLYGVMVASGGSGGSANNTGGYGGGGGAGGVIGWGAKIQVPIIEAGTYRFTVGSTTPTAPSGANQFYEILNGQHTWISKADGTVIATAVGGGHGGAYNNSFITPGQGGSGGGSIKFSTATTYRIMQNGRGVPGQGNDGSLATSNGGAGGGYSTGPKDGGYNGELTAGGDGFDLVTALDLDPSDTQVQDFITAYTGYGGDGWIAGGGGGFGANDYLKNPGGKGGGGNGYYTGDGADTHEGKDFTGGGGGGSFNTQGVAGGGAGAVYLIGDV